MHNWKEMQKQTKKREEEERKRNKRKFIIVLYPSNFKKVRGNEGGREAKLQGHTSEKWEGERKSAARSASIRKNKCVTICNLSPSFSCPSLQNSHHSSSVARCIRTLSLSLSLAPWSSYSQTFILHLKRKERKKMLGILIPPSKSKKEWKARILECNNWM